MVITPHHLGFGVNIIAVIGKDHNGRVVIHALFAQHIQIVFHREQAGTQHIVIGGIRPCGGVEIGQIFKVGMAALQVDKLEGGLLHRGKMGHIVGKLLGEPVKLGHAPGIERSGVTAAGFQPVKIGRKGVAKALEIKRRILHTGHLQHGFHKPHLRADLGVIIAHIDKKAAVFGNVHRGIRRIIAHAVALGL